MPDWWWMTVSQGFDSNFKQFARDLEAVGRSYGKSQKKFLRQEGGKLLRADTLEELVEKTGLPLEQALASLERYNRMCAEGNDRDYRYNGADAIRVYSSAPHAHLIEEGHRIVTHDGTEVGFVRGHHVFELAAKEFESQFYTDLDEYLEEAVDIK